MSNIKNFNITHLYLNIKTNKKQQKQLVNSEKYGGDQRERGRRNHFASLMKPEPCSGQWVW